MNRKDDHIAYAHAQTVANNDFDLIRFKPHGLPETNKALVNYATEFLGNKVATPIYINAMTGGSKQAQTINGKLSALASHFGLPMALGSYSSAYQDASLINTYDVINAHDGFLKLANVGADKPLVVAKTAVQKLNADGLQIHINSVQELIMPEGERVFKGWSDNIKAVHDALNVPVMVKEVGFGMSTQTFKTLKNLGIVYIDVSGRGGTNFASIENKRRISTYQAFEQWGLSTVESLLQAEEIEGIHLYASGGIRHAGDVVKALALGAEAVGLSKFFLTLAMEDDLPTMIEKTAHLLDEIKTIMCALGVDNVKALNKHHLIIPKHLWL